MATESGRKRSSSARSTKNNSRGAARTTQASRQRNTVQRKMDPEQEQRDRALKHEIGIIALFVVLVILFFCNFGIIGPAGNAVSGVMFGIFGFLAYILPVPVFWTVLFAIANAGNPTATRKIAAGTVLFVNLEAVCELIAGKASELAKYDIKAIYEFSAENKAGGGIIGGSLAYLFEHYLGTIGAVLVILLCMVISGIILTERSLLAEMKHGGSRIKERTRLENERRRVYAEEARERRESQRKQREEERMQREAEKENEQRLRMEKKVSGVTMDTELKDSQAEENSEDIHEITYSEETFKEEGERTAEPENGTRPEVGRKSTSGANSNLIDFEKIRIRSSFITPAENEIEEIVSKTPTEDEADYFRYNENLKNRGNGMGSILDGYDQNADTYRKENTTPPEEKRMPKADFGNRNETIGHAFAPEKNDMPQYNPENEARQFDQPVGEQPYTPRIEDFRKAEKVENRFQQTADHRPVAKLREEPPHAGAFSQKIPDAPVQMQPVKEYRFPSIELLKKAKNAGRDTSSELKETAARLQQTLNTFGVKVTITDISQGPSVTRYELQPEQGVKVAKILSLSDDIKLNLAATDIRIEAPIPGKAAIGIEVPNKENTMVSLRELIESREFEDFQSNLAFAVGKDIAGKTIVADIAKMPHMLIAGSTGSGKSVCINTLIMSILYKARPEDVKLIMVDPKVVELSVYNGIPHLLLDVVTDPKKASAALHWGVTEMDDRYKKLAEFNVRDVKEYNKKVESMKASGAENVPAKMPQIVIIVDELADLMMVAPGEVEESICRLAQLARAAGIHLVIATQRPSVDVITGLIKANMPSRVAFAVSSGTDSRTILDMNGAEKLLGKGDMLFYPQGYSKPARIQGAFVSDEEVSNVVDFLKNQNIGNVYTNEIAEKIANMGSGSDSSADGGSDRDELFEKAGRFIIDKDKASIGSLQRLLKVGFNRAARIMDQLCDYGVVGEEEGTKPRKVLMTMEEFEQLLEEI